jgi:nicotinic acid mononucleotide adenylyltransferase
MTTALLNNLSDSELIRHFDQIDTTEAEIAANKIQELLDAKHRLAMLEEAYADACCDIRVVQSQLESANDALANFDTQQDTVAQ